MDGLKVSIASYYRIKYVKIIHSKIKREYQNISIRTGLGFKQKGESIQRVKIQFNHPMKYWLEMSIAPYHRMKYIKINYSLIRAVY